VDGFADIDAIIARAMGAWRPPPRLSLSAWADRNYVLSAETAAEPGRWRSLPYQVEVMNSITDPTVSQVTVMKSARVGYTLMVSAAIGFYMEQDPSSILVVQPTVDDAKNFSKETISPMLRDVPVLSRLVFRNVEEKGKGPKDPSGTLQQKAFPGGILSLIGANSGSGFRRVSRRVVIFDEVDAYPPSAGSEGDPIHLGMKRSEAFYNRKTVAGSTPLVSGASRIEELFLAGDQRRYHVPCPHCSHMDYLAFKGDRGHLMRWPDGRPAEAYFECRACGCSIEHKDKRWMVERGKWIPDNTGASPSHRSYHLWSALSYSPNASWAQIAAEFLEAKRGGPEKLKTFVNTTLGETWKERGEAPEWERLYQRRESYAIGSVPAGPIVLTAGVDVQKDRLVYEVVGWSATKESWSIDAGELHGETALESTWAQLDELLARSFPGAEGDHHISMLAVDSGYNTQVVYGWARRHPMSRVIACKGFSGARMLVNSPSPVDVTVRGKRLARGYKVWTTGVDIAKAELYGWLGMSIGADGVAPAGYCHFPEYGERYFQELTSETLVTTVSRRTRRQKREWMVQANMANHFLDARILARVAAAVLGIDRLAAKLRVTAPSEPSLPPARGKPAQVATPAATTADSSKGFLKKPRPGGWFGKRR
jgi:phage terminase large subunit GpA-like protein